MTLSWVLNSRWMAVHAPHRRRGRVHLADLLAANPGAEWTFDERHGLLNRRAFVESLAHLRRETNRRSYRN